METKSEKIVHIESERGIYNRQKNGCSQARFITRQLPDQFSKESLNPLIEKVRPLFIHWHICTVKLIVRNQLMVVTDPWTFAINFHRS